MRKALTSFVMFVVLSTCAYAVQVDGYCYLENQTNHEGSKVLFQADSPGSVTDSTYTEASGYYQIDLTAGAYDVYFTHQGYFGEEILDQILFSATTMPEVTLAQAPAGIEISGELSGALRDTTYFVIGNVWVSSGDSLTIEAGAELIFGDEVQFDINGYLYAAGTETDSVKFLNSPDLTWGGIDFNGSADDNSLLEYCFIYGASSSGISCNSSSPSIENCAISGNTADCGGGIQCGQSSFSITNCTISSNTAACFPVALGGGIYCCAYSSPSITNCTISGNTADNGGGICFFESSADILNTIVEGNFGFYGIVWYESSAGSSISFSDFYNNEIGNFSNPPQYIGQIVTVNANGDSCDMFMNIFENPIFYSTTGDSAYYLTAESPCIDAGDPTYPLDPDSTIADIGAFYYDQGYIPPEPDICVSYDELDFGLVPVGNQADLPLTIYSTGDTTLVIQGIFTSEDAFYTDFDPADSLIEPGDSLELTVIFEPLIERMYDETLFIVSNAEEDTVTVFLLGDGGAVPDSVENLVITLEYPDAVLSWDAVTTSVSGYPIQVDYYLIFFETDAYDEFEFLAYTAGTIYTHSGVVQFAESQFYFVEAYIGNIGVLEAITASGETISREELYSIIRGNESPGY